MPRLLLTTPSMSAHQRLPSSSDANTAYYQAISQDEVGPDDQRVPEDDETLAEEFLTQAHVAAHDRRIYWIHLILGSAVLLPWNGKHTIVCCLPQLDG